LGCCLCLVGENRNSGGIPPRTRNPRHRYFPLAECNLSYATGIWPTGLDADAWRREVDHGSLQPRGTVGSLVLSKSP
jgi:hypothetical protein